LSGLRTWPGRPAGLSLHLGQDLGTRPAAPAWLPQPRRVERVRIGSSLCPRLLPPLDRLRHAARSALSWTARLELETPVLGDGDLLHLDRLLDALEQIGPAADVVVNDWGALRLLRRRHPGLTPVIGRVLHRQVRDPRIPTVDPQRLGGWPAAWGLGSAVSPSWQALVRSWGVERVELDWPLHGLDTEAWNAVDLQRSLHLPYVLVASGRSCVQRDPRGAVDRADGGDRCDLSCRHTAVHLEAPWTTPGGDDRPTLLRMGNAELARLDPEALQRALSWAAERAGADRIVVFPEGP